jgi:hypothetical protein
VPPDDDGDLTTGTSARYVIIHTGPRPRVRVITDVLGDLQAYLELP